MVMHTGGRVVLSANKAGQIRNMLNQYIVESNSGTYDYVKALAAFSSRDDGALAFKKGEVIAVVPKHDAYTEKVNLIYNFIIGMHDKILLIAHSIMMLIIYYTRIYIGLAIWHQRRQIWVVPIRFCRKNVANCGEKRDENDI